MKLIYETKGYLKIKDLVGAKRQKDRVFLVLVALLIALAGLIGIVAWQAIGGEKTEGPGPISFVSAKGTPSVNSSPVGTIVLGRPTDTSVTANVIPDKDWEIVLQYGTKPGDYPSVSAPYKSDQAQPIFIDINGLKPDTQYYYRMGYRTTSGQSYQMGAEYKFHTARATGDSFTFAIQTDAHFDINSSELYKVTTKNMLNSNPDFLIDLGDKTMSGAYAATYQDTQSKYAKVRYNMSLAGDSVPVFLANGNHDAENGWLVKNGTNNVAYWATNVRKLLFANPTPNDFYSGDQNAVDGIGLRNSYYAWKWGDAQFIVLDPYWNSEDIDSSNSNNDMWNMTLGDQQYHWLENTLKLSNSKYKFVFAHHILGNPAVHGGIYWAKYGEWGGYNKDGSWGFSDKRPNWGMPISQLFEKYKVNIFFQGHDHIFAQEQQGSVIYQEVPQPNSLFGESWLGRHFTYDGVTMSSSGYIRVTVNPGESKVDYVKSLTPSTETKTQRNAGVPYSYSVKSN